MTGQHVRTGALVPECAAASDAGGIVVLPTRRGYMRALREVLRAKGLDVDSAMPTA